ncbi:MAG: hypothetical protein O2779_05630 [Nanoarchaeota archaeon]|nr:hypothetical protein [Nanoarchaeota archaeon]
MQEPQAMPQQETKAPATKAPKKGGIMMKLVIGVVILVVGYIVVTHLL